ncbi:MAG: FKBP-type peptidyl-prolyl cis-trans isomerase [Coriobacteriales bacterium]|nr:FKBP-type peptidyl-prolyl cis-trans isomerase [Coriobacteriales bacterium]
MSHSRIIRTIAAMVLVVALALPFSGCTGSNAVDLGPVAATVRGTDIYENEIAKRIEFYRTDTYSGEVMDDATWAYTLKTNGYTPETLREFVIRDVFALPVLILSEAEAAGITPDTTTIDDQIAEQKAAYASTETGWQEWLEANYFLSEDAYRKLLLAENVIQPLLDAKVPTAVPTQEEIDTYIEENASSYAGKRLSVIYFPLEVDPVVTAAEEAETAALSAEATAAAEGATEDDIAAATTARQAADEAAAVTPDATIAANNAATRTKAEEVLAEAQAEGSDFAALADANISDAYPTKEGGDIGWGAAYYLPTECSTVVETMAAGEVSDLIETDDAIYIIKATEEYVAPETETEAEAEAEATEEATDEAADEEADEATEEESNFDLAAVPESLKTQLTEDLVEEQTYEDQQAWMEELSNSDEIVINPMPTGLAYAVDMTLAEVQITDTVVGEGAAAQTGDLLEVKYTGMLEDGTVFDSNVVGTVKSDGTTVTDDQTFLVTLGEGSVITGWEEGLIGMQVGGKRTLVIPSALGYGSSGSGGVDDDGDGVYDSYTIPPGATLTFEIELISLNGLGADGLPLVNSSTDEGTEGTEGTDSTDTGTEGATE